MFKSNGFKILLAAIFIMAGLILYSISADSSFIFSGVSFVTTPISKMTSRVSDSIGSLFSKGEDTEQLESKVADLEAQLRDLRAITIDYYDIKKENAQFAKYYDLKQKDTSIKFVPGSVIGRDPSENFYGFTLDEGSLSGIEVNDPVATENGLVGWVYEVSANSCKVRTILSPEASVGVVDIRSGDSGVIKGSISLADQGLTKMMYLSEQRDLKQGDILVTSGLSGIYPKNFQVGEVREISYDDFDSSLYAVVKPFEDILNIKDVIVITYFQGKDEVVTSKAADQVKLEDTASSGSK